MTVATLTLTHEQLEWLDEVLINHSCDTCHLSTSCQKNQPAPCDHVENLVSQAVIEAK